jgi:RimJ/RimL family protein N-acetyltransferase
VKLSSANTFINEQSLVNFGAKVFKGSGGRLSDFDSKCRARHKHRMNGIMLETPRLRLRSHRDDDLANLVGLIGNWEIARWVSTVPHPYTEDHGREWIASVRQEHAAGRSRRFAIALKDGDRLIGGVGIDGNPGNQSDEPALGYWLGQPYWGKGYGREAVAAMIDYAFRSLGTGTIRAYTDPGNEASQKVLLHCGLQRVGEIELTKPSRNGALRAPLFRILRQPVRK